MFVVCVYASLKMHTPTYHTTAPRAALIFKLSYTHTSACTRNITNFLGLSRRRFVAVDERPVCICAWCAYAQDMRVVVW